MDSCDGHGQEQMNNENGCRLITSRRRPLVKKEVLKEPIFLEKIIEIIRAGLSDDELRQKLNDYHENDIAQSLEQIEKEERTALQYFGC